MTFLLLIRYFKNVLLHFRILTAIQWKSIIHFFKVTKFSEDDKIKKRKILWKRIKFLYLYFVDVVTIDNSRCKYYSIYHTYPHYTYELLIFVLNYLYCFVDCFFISHLFSTNLHLGHFNMVSYKLQYCFIFIFNFSSILDKGLKHGQLQYCLIFN